MNETQKETVNGIQQIKQFFKISFKPAMNSEANAFRYKLQEIHRVKKNKKKEKKNSKNEIFRQFRVNYSFVPLGNKEKCFIKI